MPRKASRRSVSQPCFVLVEALREGAVSGEAMDPDRAIRRETVQPASVSRIIERFGDRLGADGMIDDADDLRTNSAEPSNPKSYPKSELFSGAKTAMGIGVAPTAGRGCSTCRKDSGHGGGMRMAESPGRWTTRRQHRADRQLSAEKTKGLPQVKSDRHLLRPSVEPSARVGVLIARRSRANATASLEAKHRKRASFRWPF